MKRLLVLAALAAAVVAPPAHAATCQGAVDHDCSPPCTAELDCGLVRCELWVAVACVR